MSIEAKCCMIEMNLMTSAVSEEKEEELTKVKDFASVKDN